MSFRIALTVEEFEALQAQPVEIELNGLKVVKAPVYWNDPVLWAYNANNVYSLHMKQGTMQVAASAHIDELPDIIKNPRAYIAMYQYRAPNGQGGRAYLRELARR